MTGLAIIAGKGKLPVDVASAATSMGFDVVIFPILVVDWIILKMITTPSLKIHLFC